ncbi:hypothetical protein ACIHDR_09265 [Nocardia sp. NPDC052278]|uniref:hypothetical protein n=1 Tax=unclassified Nocardia TaxID=2637762 RepID=UPI0036BCDD59
MTHSLPESTGVAATTSAQPPKPAAGQLIRHQPATYGMDRDQSGSRRMSVFRVSV